jgi:hypothetical protein
MTTSIVIARSRRAMTGFAEQRQARPSRQKEKSRLAAGPSCSRLARGRELTAALALLIGLLALAVRILLLLSGLLAAALLLTGLLTRVLVLLARVLARILGWVGHRDLPG